MRYAGHAGFIHDSSASVAYSAPGFPLKISDVLYPRPNTRFEEAAAIATMLIFFGWVSQICAALVQLHACPPQMINNWYHHETYKALELWELDGKRLSICRVR